MRRSCRDTLHAMAQVLTYLLSGFVSGALARFAVPGPDPMPAWLTISIGLVGTVIGAGIVYAVAGPHPPRVGVGRVLRRPFRRGRPRPRRGRLRRLPRLDRPRRPVPALGAEARALGARCVSL